MYLFMSRFVFFARGSSQDRDRRMHINLCCELLNTLCLCLSFLVGSRILIGKIFRLSKMLVPDGKCGPQMSLFWLTSFRGSWGRI